MSGVAKKEEEMEGEMEGDMEGEEYDDSDSEDEVHDTPFMRPGHCHGSNQVCNCRK
jgi:hypothetical protein